MLAVLTLGTMLIVGGLSVERVMLGVKSLFPTLPTPLTLCSASTCAAVVRCGLLKSARWSHSSPWSIGLL